jgi:hypothetical protein
MAAAANQQFSTDDINYIFRVLFVVRYITVRMV